jgi:hypothetical protein
MIVSQIYFCFGVQREVKSAVWIVADLGDGAVERLSTTTAAACSSRTMLFDGAFKSVR